MPKVRMNQVVVADPSNDAARLLQADTLEQLGYQSESGPWRAFYLTGAQELRNGTPVVPGLRGAVGVDVMRAMTPRMVLDNCGVKLNTPRAIAHELVFHITFSDHAETHELVVHNGVFHVNTEAVHTPVATITTTVESIVRLTSATSTIDDETAKGTFVITGDRTKFETLIELLDQFEMFFAIIEP